MQQLLQLFVLVPLAAFLVSLVLPRKNESLISGLSIFIAALHLAGVLAFSVFWLVNGYPVLNIKHIVFYRSNDIEIFIDLYFDKSTAVFAAVGTLLTFLVAVFSKYYMHRDPGFKRFFSTLLFFFSGYNLVIFAGNFETLFIGWEILGICSFLLIAYYRDRYLPVKNGLKVISVYRFGDICLILAMWMSHHLWHENITFIKFNDLALVRDHIQEHSWYSIFLALMIVVAAAAKSAQLPFSSWLPRAMEGPTTSSAIFYGSLSVHIGVFLLLRTYPYWESMDVIKFLIIIIGLSTSIIATIIARVQSTVKTQIAYSSVAQIGIMFIEVALGFHYLALIHFTGNAFLRTYQLLVSPSVMSYLIHDMVFNFKPKKETEAGGFIAKLKNSLYILSLKEWNLDLFQYRFLWTPFKHIGRSTQLIGNKVFIILLGVLFLYGVYSYYDHSMRPSYISLFLSLAGLLLVLRAFAERGNALKAGGFVIGGQLFITLSIALLNEEFGSGQILIYLSGSFIAAVTGYLCLKKLRSGENDTSLNQYHGYTYNYPKTGFVFLIACLAFIGLPFTPTFIGIDLLFSHIHKNEVPVIILTALSFLFIELAVLRIYARIFLGQPKKADHAMAFRYS